MQRTVLLVPGVLALGMFAAVAWAASAGPTDVGTARSVCTITGKNGDDPEATTSAAGEATIGYSVRAGRIG